MTQPRHAAAAETLAERFLRTIRRRDPKHTIEDEEFVAMLWRQLRAFEARTIDNPENLPQAVALARRLDELVNVALAANAERYAIDPRRGASAAECGRILGASKQAASQRRARGKAIMAARIAAAGAIPFAEARRERQAISAAAEHAVVSLAEWRARRAA
jgi:hypothetical protein